MKKLFTLLTLLVAIVTGAWGETVTVGRTAAFSADTHANTLLPADNSDLTVTIADGNQSMGANSANNSTKDICYKSTDKVKIDAFLCYRTYINSAGLGSFDDNAYAGFKVVIAEGKYLELSQISGKVATADDGTVCRIIVEDDNGTALQTSSDKTVDRNSGNDFTVASSLKLTGTVYVKMHYWTTKEKDGAPHPSKYIVPVELSITGNLESSTAPIISTNPKSINLQATESGEAVNSSFTITGSNLTDGIYDLAIPSVAGLSVLPTSFTVSNGSVNQTVNVSYSSTENVPANTANITATVNELNLSVAVNYSASVTSWTLQTINTAKTWDFSKLTANTSSARYNSSDKAIKLSDETNPKITDEIVYEDYKDADMAIASDFDGTALSFKGQYPIRRDEFCQNGTLHFKTSVPGTIKVKFSDTGSSASATAVKRYLVVNDENTEYWASRENNGAENPYSAQLNVTTGEISVPAGDVTIKGSSAIVVSYLSFTPAENLSATITSAGWATLYTPLALDFAKANPSGLTAYTATLSNNTVTLTEVQNVQAGTGVVLKGDAGNYTIPVAENSSTAKGDMIGNAIAGTELAAETAYILNINGAGKAQFFINNAGTIAAGKAYLPVGTNHAKALSVVFADDMTGITNANAAEEAAQPAKRIVNGQLVIEKNGKRYNAAGAEF